MNSIPSLEYYGIIDNRVAIYRQHDTVPIEISGGNLVQVTQDHGEQIIIKIFSLQAGTLLWSTDLFRTKKCNVIPIAIKLWEILLGVKYPEARTRIMKNGKGFTKFLLGIKVGSKVTISGSVINKTNDVHCIVRYMGYVPQIGPGVFFGFEFTDPSEKIQPRNNLPMQYCKCDSSKSIIRAADCFLNVSQYGISKNRGVRDFNRPYQNIETPNIGAQNLQPSTSSNGIPPVLTKRKPKPKTTETAKEAGEIEKDPEIEELRKKIELLELQLKEKALKEKLSSEDAGIAPSEAKVYHRSKPKRNNKQYNRNKRPEDTTFNVQTTSVPNTENLRNASTMSLSQTDISYFERISSAAPPVIRPINIFGASQSTQSVSIDSPGYRELLDFLN